MEKNKGTDRRITSKDNEFSGDLSANDLIKTSIDMDERRNSNSGYIQGIQSLPESVKALLIISWICAALAGFVSVYFAILGIVTAYAASRTIPGIGRAALITNVVLAVINIALSIAFMATVRNFFAFL